MKFSFDRILFTLSIGGLCAILFVAGFLALHYKVPPAQYFFDAFSAADAWRERAFAPPANEPTDIQGDPRAANEAIIANPIFTTWEQDKAFNGYTLVSTGFMDTAWLIDMEGNIVHRWDMPFKKAWKNPKHIHRAANAVTFFDYAQAFPNGDLLVQYSALGDTPYGYGILKLDKNSKVLWKYSGNAHHDFYRDKTNGNIYALTHTMHKKPVKGVEDLRYPMLVDYIIKLSPEGKELDRLSLLEAFRDSAFAPMLYHGRNGGLAKWDHFHTNSIMKLESDIAEKFPLFKAGQILVSIRSMHAIAVVDMEKRKVIWAYGGGWEAQHAAHFLPNGHILLLDNRGHVEDKKNYSRAIEFDPQTLGVKWHYAGNADRPFYTSIVGRLQRLPNGNTLIAESMKARIFEITPEGESVWSYTLQRAKRRDNTLNAIFTATRYQESDLPFLHKTVQ